ncbi:protoporphyrinogen oxidase [Planococcus lenghuensis]|uniref:Coproporphyrinogen III oxidase n=1 Tax=Planococcus lenghuensis TaxID=2213202 RepID=A0A1Q2KW49_9BACL|nr:protoporphyrinogen oxidase [Planococcus lenghuensis]AQQ51892.1 protoporphyrinogen oxidase [Planococcus lenghuensis]
MTEVAVIGGGITGLSALHYLQKLNDAQQLDLKLTLLEQDEQLGGKIHTVRDSGFIMESGADSIVARHQSVSTLIEELNLQNKAVDNATGVSYLYTNDELHAIPEDTIFGIPMTEEALFRSTLVSEEGKREALNDLTSVNETFTHSSSVGEFLEAFLGKELTENQIAPMLSGVYSGKLNELTLASTLPYLLDYKNEYGSIIKGLAANKEKFQAAANKKFLSFDGGLSVLIDRLEEVLTDVRILKSCNPENVAKKENGYSIRLSDGTEIAADAVVLAIPHEAAQRLLADSELDEEFGKLENSSLTSIYLGFSIPDAALPADGTGFIVSDNSDIRCNACTWTSRKWPHTSKERELLVRLFYKSSNPGYAELEQMTERELAAVALEDIRKSLGIEAEPTAVEVAKWNGLMPNYSLQHKTAVTGLEEKVAERLPGIYLAGASYYGVGIGACIENGKKTAEAIARQAAERKVNHL